MTEGKRYPLPGFIEDREELGRRLKNIFIEFYVFVVDDPKAERSFAELFADSDGEIDEEGVLHEFAKVRKNTRVWRKRIWGRLKNSVFSGMKIPENKSPGYKTGLLVGICLNSISFAKKDLFSDQNLRNHLDRSASTAEQPKLSDIIITGFNNSKKLAIRYLQGFLAQDAEDAHDLLEGFAKGKKSPFFPGQKNPLVRHTTATEYLLIMLSVGKELERMDTVADMYTYLKHFMKENFLIEWESFRDLCNRIGLQGRLYRRNQRKSISKRGKGYE